MNKYNPLLHYLKYHDGRYVKLSFKEVEKIISGKLPPSASLYREWWANGGHMHANAWLEAEWRVEQVKLGEYVEFAKNK